MNASLPLIAALLYLGAAVLLGLRLHKGVDAKLTSKVFPLVLWFAGLAVHLPSLYADILTPAGLHLAFFNVLALAMDVIALVLLATAVVRPVENLGVFVLPMAALTAIVRMLAPVNGSPIGYANPGLQAHILLSILAYSLFAIAAVQALLLAIQHQHLRNRHPGGFIRALPPLDTMEQLLFQMIAVGYVLLTLALASGALYLHDIFAQHLVHKTVLSIFAWLLFSVLLWGRRYFGWRGRTAVRLTLSGFVVLMLAYFGSKFVLELLLGQG
ncbi:MAG: inner membrane protein YpjD [Thiohalomonadaceae bacterium]